MDELQENFDPVRYQGLWYDVARFPKFFDWNTPWQTAEYTLKRDYRGEYIEVHNTAYYENGTVKKEILGKARSVSSAQPAALHVSFPNLLSVLFDDQNRANYLVHRTDYENYAVVGSYDRNSLYFLARQRPISEALYDQLLEYAASLDYDVRKLQEDYGSIQLPSRSQDGSPTVSSSDDEGCIIA